MMAMNPGRKRRRTASCWACLLLASLPLGALDEASHQGLAPLRSSSTLEERLVWALLDIREGRLEDALDHTGRILETAPDFELAHLVRGDLLTAMRAPLGEFGALPTSPEQVDGLRHEARARLTRYLDAPSPRLVPAELMRLPPGVEHAILVDTANYRLYLYRMVEQRAERVLDFYVSIGKGGTDKQFEGDEKTPTGLYRVASYLPGSTLPDLYGLGAFPIDYPNDWDALHGRTGSGIWIHGTESARYSRPPLSSRGCVTLSNDDFASLRALVDVGTTPVILARGVRWVPQQEVETTRANLLRALDAWREDWESRDAGRYLSHYSDDFRTEEMDRAAFAAHKRRVNPSKRYIRIGVDNVSMFGYPNDPSMVVVDFDQSYESDNFRAGKRKRQHWRLEEGRWKIVFEG